MNFNLVVLIFINILFQSQFSIVGNYSEFSYEGASTICDHSRKDKDYWDIFQKNLNQILMSLVQTLQIFIFIPSVIGIVVVINYSGKLLSKYFNNMKLLLFSSDENIA